MVRSWYPSRHDGCRLRRRGAPHRTTGTVAGGDAEPRHRGCVLFNEPNVRYATGASAMPVYAMSTFVRCAVVPQEGTPILFEHANSMHRSALRAPDVRPMRAWEFYDDPQAEAERWAEETLTAIRELGGEGDAVAVDRLGAPATSRSSIAAWRSETRRR
jgi:Xaa-Pro aminopeptidase